MADLQHVPRIIAEITEVAGAAAAWELVQALGGRTVYIPAKVTDDHWLTQAVGREAAEKICAHYAANNSGHRMLIPVGRQSAQRQRMVKALESGMTAGEAARASGMHERTAYRARKRLTKKDPSQGNLF